ncbi:sensor histidine kinase [Luteibacter sp. NPDC031894]|jgi:hypothetical protein|uniref:sensor histidine kinase n=1 Tax=Luteibacter sp. NPDC031894 TaxID=3390572 RepID=UPI003D091474
MNRQAAEPRHQTFWLFQLGGWIVYCAVSALGALPYRNSRPIVLYFVATAAAGGIASLPLRALCRWLMARVSSWAKIIAVTFAACYGLGFACSLTGAFIEARLGHLPPSVSSWRAMLLVSFSNALSPTIVLVAWSGIYYGVRHWQETRRREQRLLLTESLAREAELRALRYQITPHFLFNTLNGISTLVGEGEVQPARRMIALLADFLRATLEPGDDGDVSIEEELQQVRRYLAIEQVRLGDRMTVRIACAPEARDVPIPHLLLQPLVENAIRHGIAPRLDGGVLTLSIAMDVGVVHIDVHDSGSGSERRDAVFQDGVGLTNTRERLAARYGAAHRFSAGPDPDRGWRVAIDIPFDGREAQAA